MKKVMICAITLLPLILLLTLFISTAVIGFSTYVYVSSIEFVEEEIYLKKIDDNDVTEQLKVNVFPLQADNKEVEFWSDDTNIATIDADGKVSSVNFGTTYVRVRSKEKPSLQASCKVIVTDDNIHYLTIVEAPKSLFFGESTSLQCSYEPTDAINVDLLYKSSDEELATVAADGTVIANRDKGGYVTITAWSKANPDASAEVKIKIYGKIQSVDFLDEAGVFDTQKSFDLPKISIYPENSIWGNEITYSISDESIARIENNERIVFLKGGKVTLTVKDEYGHEISKTYESTWGHYDSISFTEDSTEIIKNYEDYPNDTPIEFKYTSSPSNATEKITLGSDNPAVISVVDGKFFVRGGGKATISMQITRYNGEKVTTTLTVTVKRKAESVDFADANGNGGVRYAVSLDCEFQINTKVLPSDSSVNVKYNVLDNDSVSVSENGLVMFKSESVYPQIAVIRATADSDVYCDISVTYIPEDVNPREIFDESTLTFVMPSSHLEQKITFAPYYRLYSDKELTFEIEGSGATIDNSLVTIVKVGTFDLKVKKGETVVANAQVNVIRKAEGITADLYATWDGHDNIKLSGDSKLYTSSKEILINISVLPEETTKQTPDSVKVSNEEIASVIDNNDGTYSLRFIKAGTVELTITIDEAVFKATVESTCGLLDDKSIVETNNKEVSAGTTLDITDLITVKNDSPVNGVLVNTAISVVTGKAMLSDNKQSVTFTEGGTVELQISYDTVSGRKTTGKITVYVTEEATEIVLKNGAFIVAESNSILLSDLFVIAPSTANYKTDASYSLKDDCSYASLNGNKLEFTDAGIVTVTITLANGINKDITFAYYDDYNSNAVEIIDGTKYVEVGKTFVIKLTEEDRNILTAESRFSSTDGNVTIANGLIITVEQAGLFDITIGKHSYSYGGIIKATGVSISLSDDNQANAKSDGTYITGLSSIDLSSSVIGVNVSYQDITYSVDSDIATVSNDGTLVFNQKGTVIVTASEKFGKSASIAIESTYGNFTSITTSVQSLTLDYDDDNLSTGYEFSSFFSGYPTQLSLTDKAVIEVSVSTATVDGFSVKLSEKTNFTLTCRQGSVSAIIAVTVNRKATSISINGTNIDDYDLESVIDIARSFVDFKFALIPSDANQNSDIAVSIDGDIDCATLTRRNANAWRLTIDAQDEIIPVKFTYANGKTKIIKYTTSRLSEIVDFDSDPIIVVKGGYFTFDKEGLNLSNLALSNGNLEISGTTYRIMTSGSYILSGTNNGTAFTKRIIVTSAFDGFKDVTINDVKHDGADVSLDIAENGTHSTASNELSVTFGGVGDAFNVNGSVPVPKYISNDNSVATIDSDGAITFHRSGTVTITIVVSGEVYGNDSGEYSDSYSFKIYSSFGYVDEFTLENANTTQKIIIDETSTYTLVCAPTLPETYGIFTQKFEYVSSNEDIATVKNGLITFHNTGAVTVSVIAVKGDGTSNSKSIAFNIDKLVDSLSVVDNNNKQRSQIILNTNTYQLTTNVSAIVSGTRRRISSSGAIEPTLTSLTYSVKDDKEGCTVSENGLITFADGAVGKFVIIIKAPGSDKTEGVQCEISIIKVDKSVKIVTVDITEDSVLPPFESGKSYIIDAGFGQSIPTVVIPEDIGVADELGVFTPSNGVSANIEIKYESSTKKVTAFVEQGVQEILIKEGAPLSVYGGAITFNLTELFDVSVYPSTAGRVVDGKFENYSVQYGISDSTVAKIDNDSNGNVLLVFIMEGKVTVTFSAGGVSKQITVQSTYGYADEIKLNKNHFDFDFTDAFYTFTDADYIVSPTDANSKKYNLTITSSDSKVLSVDGFKVNFVGGGEATLTFEYSISSSAKRTETVTVKVVKHADGISVSYKGSEVQNILTSENDFSLATAVLGSNISTHIIEYVSSDSSIASVDANGRVILLKKGVPATITVSLISQFDSITVASKTITVRQAPYGIKEIDNTKDVYEFNYNKQLNYSLYYVDLLLPTTFTITDKNGNEATSTVLSINEYGDITLQSSGSVFITATADDGQRKTFEVRVYKKAENIVFNGALDVYLTDGEYVMAGVEIGLFDGNPLDAILPLDAVFGKTVEFSYDTSIADIDSNGNVTFKTKDTLVVTVLIKCGDETDFSKEIKLRSTLGTAITANVYKDGANIESSYSIDVGNSIVFNVADIKPIDLQLTTSNFIVSASTTNVVSIDVDAESKTITVTGVGKGTCLLTINVAGKVFTVNINSILKVNSVQILYNNEAVTNLKTVNSKFKLTAIAFPTTANDTSIEWILPAEITMDADNNFTVNGGYGKYSITARAKDGSGCSATIEIDYEDLSGFGLQLNGNDIQNGDTAYLKYNENSMTFTIIPHPAGLQGFLIDDFKVKSEKGYDYSIIRDQVSFKITLTTPTSENELHFEDKIEVTYKGLYAFSFNIYRSGVQSVSFKYYNPLATDPTKADLDNDLDIEYGYQQMRVFGNQSYYDGIQGYYKMHVEVKPQQDYLQYVDFTAEKGLTVTRDSSSNEFVYVNFNSYVGNTLDAILADLTYDFSDGSAKVSATDIGAKLGASAYSYDFHVVSGVNVFDKAGYLNGGANVVLHVNLTHDDEDTSGLSNRVRFDDYATSSNTGVVNKTTIYGNGYLINFANKNNYKTKSSGVPEAETKYGYNAISILNAINVSIKGTNDIVAGDSSRKYYFIELAGVSNIYYCEAYNMLRVIENYNKVTNIKRCLFRTCAESGAISSYQDSCVDSNSMNFTDVIMFDTGSRAIETHSNPIRVYGFLDVYNFQNRKALNKALINVEVSGGVFDHLDNYSEFIENQNGDDWFNMVALSAKGGNRNMYYNDVIVSTDSVSKNGIKKIVIEYKIIFVPAYTFSIWGYPTDSAPISWSDQFNSDGTLNNGKMMSTTWKITRTQNQS